MEDRSKFRNPSPPPGYVSTMPHMQLKGTFQDVDGLICEFLGLIIESGILKDQFQPSDFEISDEEELVECPVENVSATITVVDISDNDSSPREMSPEKVPIKKKATDKISSKQKKRKSIDKEKNDNLKPVHGYKSDSPCSSSSHSKKKWVSEKKRSKSPRSSEVDESDYSNRKRVKNDDDSDYFDRKRVKNDPYYNYRVKEESDFLYGLYYCEICKAGMNNDGAYQSHMKGKRHLKTVKQKNIAKAVEDSVQLQHVPVVNRYPQPPPKAYRSKAREIAKLQKDIERQVRTPCPGLEKVIEIQGLHKIHYYCEMCDAPCNDGSVISHLKGFPHQFQCLKHFEPKTYERLSRMLITMELKSKVIDALKTIQDKYGCGKLTVEKESLSTLSSRRDRMKRREAEDLPGPIQRHPESSFPQCFAQTVIPDSDRPDFYCPICDSHMNNHIMWESHIRGKRHITNCKKAPGQAPSKTKAVFMPNARALLMEELEYVGKPVVGLDHIRETQKPEAGGALYNCFLCGACCGSEDDVIDHILSQKHRSKYLEKIDHPDIYLLNSMTMTESRMCGIVENICAAVEEESGRGNIEVYVSKNAVARW